MILLVRSRYVSSFYKRILRFFVEDSINVRFVLHPGIDQMKADWHHSKFKQI